MPEGNPGGLFSVHTPFGLRHKDLARLATQWTRDQCIPTSPALGFQACATPGISTWVLEIKLRASCLGSKYVTSHGLVLLHRVENSSTMLPDKRATTFQGK